MQLFRFDLALRRDTVQKTHMVADIVHQLETLCAAFAAPQGDVSIMIQSKADADVSVSLNGTAPLPSASVIKAAIACTAADLATRSELDLHQTFAKSELNETFYCSILHAFDDEDRVTFKTLIGLMLIASDNPATSAVLDVVGMDAVNAWLQKNGMTGSNLAIGFEDDALGAPLRANVTTANDCLKLLQLIDQEPPHTFVKRMLANNLRNERIPKFLPDDAVIAHKTGTLAGLMHDVAIIESPVAAYYLVVLADNLSDDAKFARDLATFSEEIYALMSR